MLSITFYCSYWLSRFDKQHIHLTLI